MARNVAASRYGNWRNRDRKRSRVESARPRDSEPRLQQCVIRGAQRNIRYRWNTPTY
jgi:hypothetical protein